MVNISCSFHKSGEVEEQQPQNGPLFHHLNNLCWHLKIVQEWDYSWLENLNSI